MGNYTDPYIHFYGEKITGATTTKSYSLFQNSKGVSRKSFELKVQKGGTKVYMVSKKFPWGGVTKIILFFIKGASETISQERSTKDFMRYGQSLTRMKGLI